MSFLNLSDKTFLITGVANKKSVAYFTAKTLLEEGATLIFTVQNEEIKSKVLALFPDSAIIICDVENEESINHLPKVIGQLTKSLDGFLHSLAFANYSEGIKPFHETKRADFLQAAQISAFSLVEMSRAILPLLSSNASIVTVSISNLKATNYGYLGPIKAMLESNVHFLAKSLSEVSSIRVNSVGAGPLKTSASAGIPGYMDNYLFAERLTLRKEALRTQEVSDAICYLLSSRSSGINASNLLIDAGMSVNYFDQNVVKAAGKGFDIT